MGDAENLNLKTQTVEKVGQTSVFGLVSLGECHSRTDTTAMLSTWSATCIPNQLCPHNAAATTTGNISVTAIPTSCHDSGHCSWNHPTAMLNALQPNAPDASE